MHDIYDRVIAEVERPLIQLTLSATRGNQIKAAAMLGLNRNTLRKKIRSWRSRWCGGLTERQAVRPLAGRQPMGAIRPELLEGRPLVELAVGCGEHVAPASVGPLVDEGLGAAFPEDAGRRRRLGRMGLHPGKPAMLYDCGPARRVHWNVQEVRDPPDRSRQVGLQLGEVQQQQVWQLTDAPPRPGVLPQRPERIAVAVKPFEEVVA